MDVSKLMNQFNFFMVYNNKITFMFPKKETEQIDDCDAIFKLRRAVQPKGN